MGIIYSCPMHADFAHRPARSLSCFNARVLKKEWSDRGKKQKMKSPQSSAPIQLVRFLVPRPKGGGLASGCISRRVTETRQGEYQTVPVPEKKRTPQSKGFAAPSLEGSPQVVGHTPWDTPVHFYIRTSTRQSCQQNVANHAK